LAQATGRTAPVAGYAFLVKDLVCRRQDGKERLARLYQPAGTGSPSPRC
jgi:hypothetical protein